MNRSILSGRERPGALASELARSVLAGLPDPETFTPGEARRLVTLLGLAGASVARHYQEEDLTRMARPREAFATLRVGPREIPFLGYFARLADATGTGHCHRDSYASLVRWNTPTAEVSLDDHVVAVVPGSFDDTRVRTYTDEPGEVSFFELLKKSEAFERAANDILEPISDGTVDILSPEAERRARSAALLLTGLYRLNRDFAHRSPGRGGLDADHFMDVFRQFAVHWESGDVPPSGAQDAEFLRRDLLLGIAFPDYHLHVKRVFPALLEDERKALTEHMGRPPLTAVLLAELGLDGAALEAMPSARLRATLRRHPILGVWYLLLTANARIGAVHLMLAEKYLFKPQRRRDDAGLGDRPLVSNRTGTTGMDEPVLTRLARARQQHALRRLGRLHAADATRPPPAASEPTGVPAPLPTVRFLTGPA
ncbi:hypothetical protein GCM10010517_14490 [Streptosporangium fragile]|uniref:Uncharacterized protein n=1 Tax=Streptosporangium fragile TaxID=46186 RepID=A0ABP6I8I4_9ACTN